MCDVWSLVFGVWCLVCGVQVCMVHQATIGAKHSNPHHYRKNTNKIQRIIWTVLKTTESRHDVRGLVADWNDYIIDTKISITSEKSYRSSQSLKIHEWCINSCDEGSSWQPIPEIADGKRDVEKYSIVRSAAQCGRFFENIPLPLPLVPLASIVLWHSAFGFPLASFGVLWLPLASFGFLWLPLASFGFLWLPLASFGFLWPPLASFGFLWLSIINLKRKMKKCRERRSFKQLDRA